MEFKDAFGKTVWTNKKDPFVAFSGSVRTSGAGTNGGSTKCWDRCFCAPAI